MASTAYDQSIRSALNQKGINNGQIGYKNGYVTVNGQNFMKADKVYNGSAYTSSQNFQNAWNNYSAPKTTPTTSAASSTYKAPTVTPGSVQVRSALQSSGYSPNSIGYSNGTVTVNNQPFVVPKTNVNGTTYTDQKSFNNALSNQRIGDLQTKIVNNTSLPTNQYTPKVDDTIQYLMDFARNQQVSDPRSTPEYAAYAAQADRRAQQGIRAAQESMGSSGFGRSTALGERAQGIQNQQEEYLETQVIPTLLAAERERQQQQYNNVANLLQPLMSQQSYADNRAQTELGNAFNALNAVTTEQQRGYDNARADAALTGYYISPDAQQAINTLLNLKQRAETPGITADERNELSRQADTIRATLPQFGINPSQFAATVNYNDASKVNVGRTMQGQQLDLAAQNQAFNQELAMQEFQENVRQFGLQYALNQLQEKNQEIYRQASLALQQDDNDRQWVALENSMSPGAEYSGMTPTQVLDAARSQFTIVDDDGNSVIPKDAATKESIYNYVASMGLPLGQDDQVMLSLGLSAKDIKAFDEKNGVSTSGK